MRPWRLPLAVFLCGGVVMAFELAGSRVMAPVVGTSLTAWTALIGIILASLSAGYWLGGRMADRRPEPARLASLIGAAAAAIAFTALVHADFMTLIGGLVRDIRIASPLGALILFAPAATLLGMVTPYAAKLRIRDLSTDGRTVGTLAALSTAGSIAGTFLAGYVLIPHLGTAVTLAMLALASAAAALLVAPTRTVMLCAAIALAGAIVSVRLSWMMSDGSRGAIMIDTGYQRVMISTMTEPATGRLARTLSTDPIGIQAAQFMDSDEPVFEYVRFFRLGERLGAPPETALLIGGAAYTWPRDFLSRNPESTMTVVEIDPGMTDIARRFFRLTDNPRMHIVHEDGRVFLNGTVGPYDIIYVDAYSGITMPFHLLTREAVARMRTALASDGVVLANVIGSLSGPGFDLLRAAVATFRKEFPHVYLFPGNTSNLDTIQNVMLVASRRDLAEAFTRIEDPLQRGPLVPWQQSMAGGIVMTDDHAPVELLTIPLLRR